MTTGPEPRRRRPTLLLAGACLAAACSGAPDTTTTTVEVSAPSAVTSVPAAPAPPDGPLAPALFDDLDRLLDSLPTSIDQEALARIGRSGDPRVAWVLADLLRFVQSGPVSDMTLDAYAALTGATLQPGANWVEITNQLITWDLPAPPGYLEHKRRMFTLVDPRWEPFFSDPESPIDWRLVSWGGVFIDDREVGDGTICPRGCIPALDDPAVTDAAGGDWYPDDGLVFGLVVDGAARAYPKNMMEVHEMVNDTLGGRRVGIPYCTLCGSAQAYLTDGVPAGIRPPLLRTSGLLIRSNKMMYDLHTSSVFDTFLGAAVSGPLRESGVTLQQVSVVTSTWGEWKAAHPATTILAEDGGIGRSYPPDPLGGRDDFGPIFPIGPVDPRLPAQAQVLGVETEDGRAVAFPVEQARAALADGSEVELGGVRLVRDGSGLRAELISGEPVASHQAFWFAWSQFRAGTLLWAPPAP